MAEVIYFLDGSHAIVTDPVADFRSIIREKLGDEAERLLDDVLSGLTAEYIDGKEIEYEKIADGYYQMLHSAVDELYCLMQLIDSPRINKVKLLKSCKNIHDSIKKNL